MLIGALLLTGCGGPRNFVAPVDNRTQYAGEIPKTYTVRRGDSLYMIAMEFDLNYLDLGRWNGLKSPYTIHRGQVLRLRPAVAKKRPRVKPKPKAKPKRTVTQKSSSCSGTLYTVRRGDSLSEVADKCRLSSRKIAQWNRLRAPYTIHVGQRLRIKPAAGSPPPAVKKSAPKTVAKKSVQSRSTAASVRLKPPVSGKITQRFSQSKGITGVEYSGKRGAAVRAAGDGKVVYSGTGLVRYGKLLIIKHDQNLLTAYAHNSALQVNEGDVVKAGQQIAKMGSSGTDRVKLHFEVRKGGKPVDPMRYLK